VFLNNQNGHRSTHRSNYISTKTLTKSHSSIGDTKNLSLYMLFGGATLLIPFVSINLPYE